jgi:hypothetical protein
MTHETKLAGLSARAWCGMNKSLPLVASLHSMRRSAGSACRRSGRESKAGPFREAVEMVIKANRQISKQFLQGKSVIREPIKPAA